MNNNGDALSDEVSEQTVFRQSMDVDVVCVGFGPAAAGFMTHLSKNLLNEDGSPAIESKVMPGMPLQVLCYERADDIGYGVSGVVTKGRAIQGTLPELTSGQIPTVSEVTEEKLLYLLDPHGASRRSLLLKIADFTIDLWNKLRGNQELAFEIPFIPQFLRKEPGFIFSLGQLCQWVGSQLLGSGLMQIWPGSPVVGPLLEGDRVVGVRLVDQGVDKKGRPASGFMPGMDIKAALTVAADGPFGAVGQQLDEHFGLPEGHRQHEWAVGTKVVVNLRSDAPIKPGTVIHTIGYPEPEIFGFMYVYPDNIASLGIFVPSWFGNPVRTSYRYLQHWMMHPSIWKYLEGGTLRSWGAKSLQESGKLGEPFLVGDGYARIGEGSGSTNVLTGSGVDEAWATGVQLAESVIELAKSGKDFTKEALEASYVARRRKSWVEDEALIAQHARSGFTLGFIPGMIGMALAGFSRGKLFLPAKPVSPFQHISSLENFYQGRLSREEISSLRKESKERNVPLHDLVMDRVGWPTIPLDGQLLISQQDALLIGGKVQAMSGYADHVRFIEPEICARCNEQVCVEICSGQAITPGDNGGPVFDREKCVHCGACIWNCSKPNRFNQDRGNISFSGGSGGFHSVEN